MELNKIHNILKLQVNFLKSYPKQFSLFSLFNNFSDCYFNVIFQSLSLLSFHSFIITRASILLAFHTVQLFCIKTKKDTILILCLPFITS